MSDLRWRADGIEAAEKVGGVALEVYRRPGFQGGLAVRRVPEASYVVGFEAGGDPDPPWDDGE